MVVFVTCKNEEDPIKKEGVRMVTTLSINFQDAQGHNRRWDLDEIQTHPSFYTCLSFFSTRMVKIHSKLKALEGSQHVSHYKSMGISDAQGQVTHKSLIGSCQISNPSEILWVSLLSARMKKILSRMKALEWSQHYSLIFQTLKGSYLRSQKWNLAEIQTHPCFYS